MSSKAASHWENWTVKRLRKEARALGIPNPNGFKKHDLIHAMRQKVHGNT